MKRINGELESMRTQDRVPEGITCACCGASTSDGKRYCTDHLEHMPYAARVMREVRLQAAKRRLRDWGRRHAASAGRLTQAG
ncbi:MAG: hypothetical protein R3F62_28345 [Planctomycetota bacterium]